MSTNKKCLQLRLEADPASARHKDVSDSNTKVK